MRTIRNEMIRASAGAGKTYALTTRFITLLALGVAPERIAALTFTRKAAGEFFDEILTRLAGAAASAGAAEKLAAEVRRPGAGSAEFGVLLRQMVDAMPRLTLGTMDSFFARIVQAFPMELGLSGEMQILDEAEAAEEVRRVMGRFFAITRERGGAQDAVLEAFKLATMGVEAKSVTRILDTFIKDYYELFRRAGDPAAWGNAKRIWPGGFPWDGGTDESEENLKALRDWLATDGTITDGQKKRWEEFAVAFTEWSPGMTWPKPLEFIVNAVLKAGADFARGAGSVMVDRRRQSPPPAVCAAIAALVSRVVALELGRRMAVTQGIGMLLQKFDVAYDADVRRSGRLTFADVLELLGASGVMAAAGRDAEARRAVDFRLDGRVDHWLLDEFQDTSRRQWDVLEGLVDEAVQDPSGERSLFYVGDVKQAIFSWRGGDPRLFGHVAARYSKDGANAIETRELNRSYRSGEALIGLINTVFGSPAIEEIFPEGSTRWSEVWRPHETAVPGRAGQAAVLVSVDKDARFRTTLELVQALDPIARGFSCAVLVQKNDTATKIAEYLRKVGGVPTVAESDLHIGTDNPWSAAFISLLRCAAHPGDSVSWEHLMMTPAKAWIESVGVTTKDALVRRVLADFGNSGGEALAATWLGGLRGFLSAGDAFTSERAAQLIAAAREFDEAGGGTVAAFIRWLEAATVRETEGADVVRVMTIHKSKGLGFDIVIVPDLEGKGLASRRDGPAVHAGEDGAVDWILEFPKKEIAGADERLRAYLEGAESDSAFDSLARLYVAMTRAKRGLYAIIEPAGASKARSYPRFLKECLGEELRVIKIGAARFSGIHSTGDSRWLQEGTAAPVLREWKPETVSEDSGVDRIARRVASETAEWVETADEVLGTERHERATHGTGVHELLAGVEWSDGLDIALWAATAIERGAGDLVVGEAAAVLRAPELRTVFACPGDGWEAWRERAFEALIDGAWVTAVVNRACVSRDTEGRVREVWLYEFKTGGAVGIGEGAGISKAHARQLATNRQVLAAATGVPSESVRGVLVYTKSRTAVESDRFATRD